MKKTLYFIILYLSIILSAFAQEDTTGVFQNVNPPCRIQKIIVIGNKKTKDNVIKRQIDYQPGDIINQTDLDDIRNKVLSLNLFNSVETYVQRIKKDTILIVDVNEMLHVFPIPYFNVVDQDWSKLNIGLGIAHINMFGENQKLFAVGWLGYDPGFSIRYRIPWFGKDNFTFGAGIFKTKINNRLYDFKESHFGGYLSFGKLFSLYVKSVFTLNVDWIRLNDGYLFYQRNSRSKDILYKMEGFVEIDHRNNIFYPTRGYYLNLGYFYAFWQDQTQKYQNMSLDLRYYFPLGKNETFAVRSMGIRRSSSQPVNDYLLLGYKYRIRGYFSHVQQGVWLNISTLSYRFPLLPIKFIHLPVFYGMDNFRKVPFGISMAFFVESGFLVDDIFKLRQNDLRSGLGAGLLFHLPYINVARFDVAINDKFDNYDFIFLVNVAF